MAVAVLTNISASFPGTFLPIASSTTAELPAVFASSLAAAAAPAMLVKGLVGSAVIRRLNHYGYKNILTVDRKKLDLRNQQQLFNFFRKNECFNHKHGIC
jgi:hypothetical protein